MGKTILIGFSIFVVVLFIYMLYKLGEKCQELDKLKIKYKELLIENKKLLEDNATLAKHIKRERTLELIRKYSHKEKE